MNILYINTCSEESIAQIFKDKVLLGEKKWFSGKNLGMDLLPNIDTLLKSKQLDMSELNAVVVNPGPGSFTGSRIGVVCANTLAWALNVPVIASDKPQKTILDLKSGQNYCKPVAVVYDRPASVTIKER